MLLCVSAENQPGSKHWQERQDWRKIKADPQQGRSGAKGIEGMV
jgi:hypothetical protein